MEAFFDAASSSFLPSTTPLSDLQRLPFPLTPPSTTLNPTAIMSPAPFEIPEQFTGYGARDEASGKKLDLEEITCTSLKL